MPTALLPTPPVAPVTKTGPAAAVSPRSSSATTDNAAVNPAVPIAMAWRASNPSGSATSQSTGTRAYSAKPPWRETPSS